MSKFIWMAYMLRTILLTVLAATVLPIPPTYGRQTQVTLTPDLHRAIVQIDSLAAAEIAKDNIGSITIGIVSGGNLLWTKSYGYADMEKKIPAIFDPKTRLGVIVLCTRKENLAFHALEILANVNRTPDKR